MLHEKSERKVGDVPAKGATSSNDLTRMITLEEHHRTHYFNNETNVTELELEKDFANPDFFNAKCSIRNIRGVSMRLRKDNVLS